MSRLAVNANLTHLVRIMLTPSYFLSDYNGMDLLHFTPFGCEMQIWTAFVHGMWLNRPSVQTKILPEQSEKKNQSSKRFLITLEMFLLFSNFVSNGLSSGVCC